MGKVKCCVPGCEDKESRRSVFPHPRSSIGRFKVWLDILKNPVLDCMSFEDIYKKKRICHRHFEDSCFSVGSHISLKYDSIPTKYISAVESFDLIQRPLFYWSGNSVSLLHDSGGAPTITDGHRRLMSTDMQPSKDYSHFDTIESGSGTRQQIPDIRFPAVEASVDASTAASNLLDDVQPSASTSGAHASIPEDPYTSHAMTTIEIEASVDAVSFNVLDDVQPSTSISGTPRPVPEGPCTSHSMTKSSTIETLRANLLKEVGVSRQEHLTPKARYFYTQARTLKKKMFECRKKSLSFRKRLSMADRFSNSDTMAMIEKQLSPVVFQFFNSQIRLSSKKAKGRRFTLADKVLALSIFKQSGKAYRLLSKIFALPSRTTLMSLLKRVPVTTGINEVIFNHLKKCADTLLPADRYCALLFDEMSLTPHLEYDERKDLIVGFEDFGKEDRSNVFADHALVFMLRGIRKKWKQPIVYTFCKGTTQSVKLANLLRSIIEAVQATPLNIVLTVSDQGATNRAAVYKLIETSKGDFWRRQEEYRSEGFFINGKEIIHLYDAPHLIKLIRNHMLTKDLRFVKDGKTQTGKWSHMVDLYNMDVGEGEMRALPKLTGRHVVPDKIKKMKVSYCTQVFSQRVASTMNLMAKRGDLDPEATETAELFLFLDQLFDSCNGNCRKPGADKALRCGIRHNSKHVEFWNMAVKVLDSMEFVNPLNGSTTRPVTLTNWVKTIQGIKALWLIMQKNGFNYLLPKNLNNDPIENHFSKIRSQGIRNNSPTCFQFAGSFKSLLLNNLVSVHSVGSNCEQDDATPLFTRFQDLFEDTTSISSGEEEDEEEDDGHVYSTPVANVPSISTPTKIHEEAAAFVTGFLAQRLDKCYSECSRCIGEVYAKDIIETHSLITAREYNVSEKRSLKYPSINLIICFNVIKRHLHNTLPKICSRVGVCKELEMNIDMGYFEWLTCEDHKEVIIKNFIHKAIFLLIYNWCKTVNRRLIGTDLRVTDYTDDINLKAIEYYRKHQSYKAKTANTK